MYKHTLTLLLALFGLTALSAQDSHFAHIHAVPMSLNPALTGVSDGQFRLSSTVRQQWQSVSANYRTLSVSADAQVARLTKSSILGGGLQLQADRAGDLNLTKSNAQVSLSMIQQLNSRGDQILAGGFQLGYGNQSYDASQIISFDAEPIAMDALQNVAYIDFSAGLLWLTTAQNGNVFYLGGSTFHLNQPTLGFQEKSSLYRRYVGQMGGLIRAGNHLEIIPSAVAQFQGPHRELLVGSFFRYYTAGIARDDNAIAFGAWWRWQLADSQGLNSDAVVAALRLDIANGHAITFSYDINMSSLARATAGRGGLELSWQWTFGDADFSRVSCPSF